MAYRTSDSGSVLGAFAMPTTSLGDKDAPVSAETLKKLPMSPNDIPSPLTPVDPATALNDREYTSPPLTDADGAGTPSHARRPGGSGASNSSLGSTNGLGPSSFPRPTSSAFDARHSAVAAYSTPIISPLTSSGVVEATDAAGRAFGPGGLIDTSPQRPVVLPSMPKAWRVTDMDGSALPNGNPDLNRQHSEETSDAFDFIESMQHRSLPLPPLPSTPGAIKMEGMAQRFHLVPDLAGSSQDGLAARGPVSSSSARNNSESSNLSAARSLYDDDGSAPIGRDASWNSKPIFTVAQADIASYLASNAATMGCSRVRALQQQGLRLRHRKPTIDKGWLLRKEQRILLWFNNQDRPLVVADEVPTDSDDDDEDDDDADSVTANTGHLSVNVNGSKGRAKQGITRSALNQALSAGSKNRLNHPRGAALAAYAGLKTDVSNVRSDLPGLMSPTSSHLRSGQVFQSAPVSPPAKAQALGKSVAEARSTRSSQSQGSVTGPAQHLSISHPSARSISAPEKKTLRSLADHAHLPMPVLSRSLSVDSGVSSPGSHSYVSDDEFGSSAGSPSIPSSARGSTSGTIVPAANGVAASSPSHAVSGDGNGVAPMILDRSMDYSPFVPPQASPSMPLTPLAGSVESTPAPVTDSTLPQPPLLVGTHQSATVICPSSVHAAQTSRAQQLARDGESAAAVTVVTTAQDSIESIAARSAEATGPSSLDARRKADNTIPNVPSSSADTAAAATSSAPRVVQAGKDVSSSNGAAPKASGGAAAEKRGNVADQNSGSARSDASKSSKAAGGIGTGRDDNQDEDNPGRGGRKPATQGDAVVRPATSSTTTTKDSKDKSRDTRRSRSPVSSSQAKSTIERQSSSGGSRNTAAAATSKDDRSRDRKGSPDTSTRDGKSAPVDRKKNRSRSPVRSGDRNDRDGRTTDKRTSASDERTKPSSRSASSAATKPGDKDDNKRNADRDRRSGETSTPRGRDKSPELRIDPPSRDGSTRSRSGSSRDIPASRSPSRSTLQSASDTADGKRAADVSKNSVGSKQSGSKDRSDRNKDTDRNSGPSSTADLAKSDRGDRSTAKAPNGSHRKAEDDGKRRAAAEKESAESKRGTKRSAEQSTTARSPSPRTSKGLPNKARGAAEKDDADRKRSSTDRIPASATSDGVKAVRDRSRSPRDGGSKVARTDRTDRDRVPGSDRPAPTGSAKEDARKRSAEKDRLDRSGERREVDASRSSDPRRRPSSRSSRSKSPVRRAVNGRGSPSKPTVADASAAAADRKPTDKRRSPERGSSRSPIAKRSREDMSRPSSVRVTGDQAAKVKVASSSSPIPTERSEAKPSAITAVTVTTDETSPAEQSHVKRARLEASAEAVVLPRAGDEASQPVVKAEPPSLPAVAASNQVQAMDTSVTPGDDVADASASQLSATVDSSQASQDSLPGSTEAKLVLTDAFRGSKTAWGQRKRKRPADGAGTADGTAAGAPTVSASVSPVPMESSPAADEAAVTSQPSSSVDTPARVDRLGSAAPALERKESSSRSITRGSAALTAATELKHRGDDLDVPSRPEVKAELYLQAALKFLAAAEDQYTESGQGVEMFPSTGALLKATAQAFMKAHDAAQKKAPKDFVPYFLFASLCWACEAVSLMRSFRAKKRMLSQTRDALVRSLTEASRTGSPASPHVHGHQGHGAGAHSADTASPFTSTVSVHRSPPMLPGLPAVVGVSLPRDQLMKTLQFLQEVDPVFECYDAWEKAKSTFSLGLDEARERGKSDDFIRAAKCIDFSALETSSPSKIIKEAASLIAAVGWTTAEARAADQSSVIRIVSTSSFPAPFRRNPSAGGTVEPTIERAASKADVKDDRMSKGSSTPTRSGAGARSSTGADRARASRR